MCDEDRREHEVRCEYFGADPSTDPLQLPYYQDTETGKWFNKNDMPVAAPLRCGKASAEQSPECDHEVEYKLPPNVEPLPPSWHWTVTADGEIYYYNLRDRIPQWEPPNAQQRLEELIDDSPVKEKPPDEKDLHADDLVDIDVDYVGRLSPNSLNKYIEAKVQERREKRRNRLVSVCMISPRREEDRIHSQQESRKYKENKEKIRRRKELFRRNNSETNNTESAGAAAGQAGDVVPIQDYLFSSDDEPESNQAGAAQPLSNMVVNANANGNGNARTDKIVSLNASKNNILGFTSSDSDADSQLNTKRKLPMPPQLTDSKKKLRDDRDRKRKT